MKRLLLSILLVASACGGSNPTPDETPAKPVATEQPAEPQSSCPIDGAEEVEIPLPTETGEALMVNGLEHDRLWNNDLNGDGMPDMILQQRGACNPDDECTVTVWLGCTPSTFTKVWGPDFAFEMYVLEETHTYNGATWVTLELARASGEVDTLDRTTLHFDGSGYTPASK